MREIKFRGMALNGQWFCGNLAILKENLDHGRVMQGSYISNKVGMPFAYDVRPETVGQFTGLKDKNGVDYIYEGDIIDSEGNLKGNEYENPNLLKEKSNFVVKGMGTKAWRDTEQKAVELGCFYAE